MLHVCLENYRVTANPFITISCAEWRMVSFLQPMTDKLAKNDDRLSNDKRCVNAQPSNWWICLSLPAAQLIFKNCFYIPRMSGRLPYFLNFAELWIAWFPVLSDPHPVDHYSGTVLRKNVDTEYFSYEKSGRNLFKLR